MSPPLVITCEHARNAVPARFRRLFVDDPAVLATHRGFDVGALAVARALSAAFAAPLFTGRVTRLLVDLNRSTHHPGVFSPFSKLLSTTAQAQLIDEYYAPFRRDVRGCLDDLLRSAARVIHISVHSHTSELNGQVRNNAIGVLYDPARRGEAQFAKSLQRALAVARPDWHVRRNYPYRGTSDGHVTVLRHVWPAQRYIGIELEINQRLLAGPVVQGMSAAVQSAANATQVAKVLAGVVRAVVESDTTVES